MTAPVVRADDETIVTSNLSVIDPYKRPQTGIIPRRMISFKHPGPGDPKDDDSIRESENEEDSGPGEKPDRKGSAKKRGASAKGGALPRKRIRRAYVPSESPGVEENVLIMDSAADQSVGWRILFRTGQKVHMDGALVGMEGKRYPIVSAATFVEDATTNQPVIVIVNQAAYNEDAKQHESLLHTDQARFHGARVNDIATCFYDGNGNLGRQSIETENISIPLLHDGSKYYVKIREPTEEELETYPAYELTSPQPWDLSKVLASLRRNKRKLDDFTDAELNDWGERLGGIPKFIVKKTLAASTQFVDSVEAESRRTPRRHFKARLWLGDLGLYPAYNHVGLVRDVIGHWLCAQVPMNHANKAPVCLYLVCTDEAAKNGR